MFNTNVLKKSIRQFIVLVAVLLVMSITCFIAAKADDDDTSDTKQRLEQADQERQQKEQELQEARDRLAVTQSGLQELEATRNTYEGQLNVLNQELALVADNLAVIEAQLALKQMELDETTANLEAATLLCEQQYFAMKERIRFMYERGNDMYLEMLFTAESFGQFLNYADYIEDLSAYDRRMLDEYIDTLATISENKALLEEEYQAIEDLRADAEAEQAKVNGLISNTSDSLAATASSINDMEAQEAAYLASCDQKAEEAAQAEADYQAIKAQYEEELRLSQLARQSAWRDISQVTFEEGDRYLLANLIYCEAGNQPYEGQVAVGAVVINRVLSSRYPDTVTGVIYQYKQFSPVLDGHLALALANNSATAACYSAADAAMSGSTTVGSCLYFRTPIEGLTGLQIGGHIFY